MAAVKDQKIMLIGKTGQVGWGLHRTLMPLGEVVAFGHSELDLADFDKVRDTVRDVKPTLIINAAAYTDVDKAEEQHTTAMAVNGTAPGVLAEEARKLGAGIVHFSTDYVFDGKKTTPYTEDDTPNPINTYGHTKLEGDKAIQASGAPYLIFRTSWVYGMRGHNFLRTILALFRKRDELRIVDDQIGAPTWSRLITEGTAQVLAQVFSPRVEGTLADFSGIYNLSAAGETSWYGFAKAIADHVTEYHLAPKVSVVTPIPSSEYPTPAARPASGVLSHDKVQSVFGAKMPGWEEQLALCLDPNQ